MKVALVQINTIVGDVDGNLSKAEKYIQQVDKNVDIILLPELLTTGYPPRDLLFREDLIETNLEAKEKLIKLTENFESTIAFGYVERSDTDGVKPIRNAICIAHKGKVLQTRFKTLLPTYDVFEEYRYFEPGLKTFEPVEINGIRVGFVICEEAWNDKDFWKHHLYDVDPVAEMVKAGAQFICCINASPYRKGIAQTRRNMISQNCTKHGVAFAYVNQTGYNDEVGFDGNSFVCNKRGDIIAHGLCFTEQTITCDLADQPLPPMAYEIPWQQEVLLALQNGIKDYFDKLGIKGPAIIGLSGGIDSALVAYLATMALGKDRVIGIGMPSVFSSEGSVSDAELIAKKLGIHFVVEPIKEQHISMRKAVRNISSGLFSNTFRTLFDQPFREVEDSGITDENLQPRIRGMYLMAISNYFNGIVLSTGNKSEMAVGYCTIYGDMCGGLAVISDVFKTEIFDLCKFINEIARDEIIPWNTINKPPSAELKKDQKDSDSLPPYETLDKILYRLVDEGKSPKKIYGELVTVGALVEYLRETNRSLEKDIIWTCRAVSRNEFKRKQAPTGLKISAKHFKYGWTQPIVHKLPVST